MNVQTVCRLICVTVVACAMVPACVGQQARPIQLDVTVEFPDGSPVDNAPIQAVTTEGAAFGPTDAAGEVTLNLDAPPDGSLVLRLWHGRYHIMSAAEQAAATDRWKALNDDYALSTSVIEVTDGVDNYAATLTLIDDVRLEGRLVDGGGQPVAGEVALVGWLAGEWVFLESNGVFEFGGLPSGQAVEIVYGFSGSGRSYFIDLDAADTLQDVDLGDLVDPQPTEDGRADIDLLNQVSVFDEWLNALGLGVSLVSTDGQVAYSFWVGEDGDARQRRWEDPAQNPKLAAGEYYLSPGLLFSRPSLALRYSILDGRQALLDAAGVPKITIVGSQTTPSSFDVGTARDAILSVGADLVD